MSKPSSVRVAPQKGVYIDSAPFWQGLEKGKLMIQRCATTGQYQWHPCPVSIATSRRSVEWKAVGGKGTIYAYTVVRIAGKGLEGRLPLAVATVELDEGTRIIANMLNCRIDEPKIGDRVRLVMDKLDETHNYPAFELDR